MYTVKIITVANGFGYQIFNGTELIAEQLFDYRVEGTQPFATDTDAQSCANDLIATYPVLA